MTDAQSPEAMQQPINDLQMDETPEGCFMCGPAPHPNCEVYTVVSISDPSRDGEVAVRLCLEHYEVVEDLYR